MGLFLGLAIAIGGCATRRASETPLVDDPDETDQVAALNAAHSAEVRHAFAGLAHGHEASSAPTAASSPRGRWSDVHLAVLYACDDTQMAVLHKTATDEGLGGWEYALRTAEDMPVALVVRRMPEPEIYDATASVGLFGDDTDRAAALLKAFDRHMAAFGRKRQFPDQP